VAKDFISEIVHASVIRKRKSGCSSGLLLLQGRINSPTQAAWRRGLEKAQALHAASRESDVAMPPTSSSSSLPPTFQFELSVQKKLLSRRR